MKHKIEPHANLRGADLQVADLREANLCGAYLQEANLCGENLCGANLGEANLGGTCLDPMTQPNGDSKGFETIDGGQWALGYRSKDSPHLGGPTYQVGELREAPIFSTADTECHPGIFVCPTIEEAKFWGDEIVKVIFRPWECHHAGEKHRVKWLIVWENV